MFQSLNSMGLTGFNRRITEHDFPGLFLRHPRLLALHRVVFGLFNPRARRIRIELTRALRELGSGGRMLDAGCGAGENLFPVAFRHPESRFVGMDLRESNVAMAAAYARATGLDRAEFVCDDIQVLASDSLDGPFDLVLIASVLQSVQHDRKALEVIRTRLSSRGRLVIYSPVNDFRLIPGYSGMRTRVSPAADYDVANEVHHRYTDDELRRVILASGYRIVSERGLVGAPGKVAYEITSLALLLALSSPGPLAVVLAVVLPVVLGPLVLILRLADRILPVSRPNALLLTAVAAGSAIEPPGRETARILREGQAPVEVGRRPTPRFGGMDNGTDV